MIPDASSPSNGARFGRILALAIGPGWRDRRDPDFWLLLIVLVALAGRIFLLTRPLDWLVSGFVNDDFFYYAGTAWNVAGGFGSSCDYGLTAHNGYHPLFMVLLLAAAWLGAGKIALVYVGLAILVVASVGAIVLAYRVGAAVGDRRLALCAPLALAFSSYFVKMSLHGFETALVLVFTLATLLACLNRRPAWEIGLWLGLVALSRIDAGFLAIPVAAFLYSRGRGRDVLVVALVSFLITSPWIVWSTANFGTPVPLSGAVKSDGFSPLLVGPGAANFARALLFQTFGQGLAGPLSWLVSFLLGLAMLVWLGFRRRRFDWIVGYVVLAVFLYSAFSTPGLVKQNQRYLTPATVLTMILFFAAIPGRSFVVPALLLLVLTGVETSTYRKLASEAAEPGFVLVGKTEVPPVLDRIVGEGDLVGCFDSGSISYFADRPVVNLDGLVNAEVVRRLEGRGEDPAAEVYARYLREKGITIMVGGSFVWRNYFPDLASWELLAEPVPYRHPEGEVVFLRVPR